MSKVNNRVAYIHQLYVANELSRVLGRDVTDHVFLDVECCVRFQMNRGIARVLERLEDDLGLERHLVSRFFEGVP